MASPPDERKERVIHARVSESLDDEIRKRAGSLGLSVSNLVRNVLQNTFGLVEDIVADSAEIARSARVARGRHESAHGLGRTSVRYAEERPRVLGWQRARLAVNTVCERCNTILPRGQEASIGVVTGGGAPPIRCAGCTELGDATEGADDGRE
jgi:hypothetical protein